MLGIPFSEFIHLIHLRNQHLIGESFMTDAEADALYLSKSRQKAIIDNEWTSLIRTLVNRLLPPRSRKRLKCICGGEVSDLHLNQCEEGK